MRDVLCSAEIWGDQAAALWNRRESSHLIARVFPRVVWMWRRRGHRKECTARWRNPRSSVSHQLLNLKSGKEVVVVSVAGVILLLCHRGSRAAEDWTQGRSLRTLQCVGHGVRQRLSHRGTKCICDAATCALWFMNGFFIIVLTFLEYNIANCYCCQHSVKHCHRHPLLMRIQIVPKRKTRKWKRRKGRAQGTL